MLRKTLLLLLIILVGIFCAVSVFAIDTSKEQSTPSPKADGVKPAGDVLLWEGFESGQVPPSGWTLLSTSAYTWEIDDYGPYEGTYNASCFYDENLNQQDEVLISPTFTGDGMTLEFYLLGSVYWGIAPFDNYDIRVWVVIGDWDGGLGDDILITEDAIEDFVTGTWMWTYCHYSLPPNPYGIPFAIAFQYLGLDGAQGSIDAISVEGCEGPCCAEVVTADEGVLSSLRGLRDGVLANSAIGQSLIDMYYNNSPEIVGILVQKPTLSIRSAAVLTRLMPGIRFLLDPNKGRNIKITPQLVARINKLLTDIGGNGSNELSTTLSKFSEMVKACEGMQISAIAKAIRD